MPALAWREGEESRLFHSEGAVVSSPRALPGKGLIACALQKKGALSHLALLAADGSELREVTEGDAVDEAPTWVPGAAALVYSSRGIGRDAAGQMADLAKAALHRLDLGTGEVSTLLAAEKADLLDARLTAAGALWYRSVAGEPLRPISALRWGLSLLLVPWAIARALWARLTFFSLRYTGKPLFEGGKPEERAEGIRRSFQVSNLMNARDASERAAPEEERHRAPASWELRRRDPDGQETVVARRVAAYDLGEDGTLAWSDGVDIYLRSPGAADRKVAGGLGVSQLVLLG